MARGREREALVALWRLGLALLDRSKPELTPLHVDILQLCVEGKMGMQLENADVGGRCRNLKLEPTPLSTHAMPATLRARTPSCRTMLTRLYHLAGPFIEPPACLIRPKRCPCTLLDALLYCYYAGSVQLARRRHAQALWFFHVTITLPAVSASAVALAATKKWILLSVLCHGEVLGGGCFAPAFWQENVGTWHAYLSGRLRGVHGMPVSSASPSCANSCPRAPAHLTQARCRRCRKPCQTS